MSIAKKINLSIEARTSSKRLPKKVLKKIKGYAHVRIVDAQMQKIKIN